MKAGILCAPLDLARTLPHTKDLPFDEVQCARCGTELALTHEVRDHLLSQGHEIEPLCVACGVAAGALSKPLHLSPLGQAVVDSWGRSN